MDRDSRLDSLDLLLNEQPEGTIPDNSDLQSLATPSMSLDLMSFSLPQETEKKSTDEVFASTLEDSELGVTEKSMKERDGNAKKQRHESLDSLDLLLDEQPKGTIPESDDLMSHAMPSLDTDLMSLSTPVNKPESSYKINSVDNDYKDTKLDNLVSFESDALNACGPEQNLEGKPVFKLGSKGNSENLDSLDLLNDYQSHDKVSESSVGNFNLLSSPVSSNKEQSKEKNVINSKAINSTSCGENQHVNIDLLLDIQIDDFVTDDKALESFLSPSKNIDQELSPSQLKQNINDVDERARTELVDQRNSRLDSLDILLNNQPDGSVPDSENLLLSLDTASMSDLKHDDNEKNKDLKNLLSVQSDRDTDRDTDRERLTSLDILLNSQPEDVKSENESLQSLMIPLMNADSNGTLLTPIEKKKITLLHDANLENGTETQKERKVNKHVDAQSNKLSDSKSMKSLDILLFNQPLGTVPDTDDLTSLTEMTRNEDFLLQAVSEESPPETTDPIEDIFDGPDDLDRGHDIKTVDTEVEDTPVRIKQGKAKLKKSMERSFEDLLHGLSDESEPELDEMILSDDNDNTNLESILVSPDQTRSIKPDKSKDIISTPARNASTTDSMDILTSTPNTETNKANEVETRAPPIEVKIDAPDDSEGEYDDKAWEMEDKEDKDDQDNLEFADEDEDGDDVVMRNKNKNSNTDTDDDKGIDLSAIEDANHLDVDINKHKSALGKKGSMALRRKQSRKSRRSVMATGEDAIFVDSTVPRPTDLLNGNDDYSDQEAEDDMSPPAKKPSPSVMVPLPGLSGKPPSQRLSASAPDDIDNDAQKPAKRISKPPPGAFKLPDVMPRLGSKSSQSPIEPTKKEHDSTSHTFEKPQLRTAKPSTLHNSSMETQKGFEAPVLRSVGGKGVDKTPVTEERDVTFEKPMLRSTPKSRETTPETNMEIETGTFTKPALKETPRKAQYDKKLSQDTPNENIIPRNLRSTNRPDIGQKPSVEKHTFDKPKLKTTGRTETVDKNDEQDKNENSYTFEKPVLRSARKESQSNDISESSVSHTFEKPVLKNTGLRNMDDKKDSSNMGKFDKPSLRKTPSPEKEVKPLHEPKGTFDKPSLRKMDNSQSVTDTGSKNDYKTSFPEMKLKKTSSPQKEVVSDKPSWLKDAADKQSKVLDVLQAKENTSISTSKDVPSWLDKTPKASRGQPLQDASNSQSEQPGERKPSFTQRSRESSIGSENDPEKNKAPSSELKAPQNNYVPSWMRQGRSPSVGTTGFVSPVITTPNSAGSDEIPQWKKDLAQRRASKKEQSPIMDTPQRDVSSEPEWKKNIQLRKTRPGNTPAKDKKSVEPEWKKAAEEKRARLRNWSNLKEVTGDNYN